MRIITAVFSVSIAFYSLFDNASRVASFSISPKLPSFVFSVDPLLTLPLLSSPTWYQKWRERRKARSFCLLGSKNTSNSASSLKSKRVDEGATAIKTKKQRNGYFDDVYRKRLEEFMEFYEEHGHGSVPCPYPPNPPLGVWAYNLRRQHKLWKQSKKKNIPYKGYLTSQRRKELLEIGFVFTSRTELQFQQRLNELKQFKEKYGHVMVPEKYEENPALGSWVINMRSLYRRKMQMQKAAEMEQNGDENEKRRVVKNIKHGRKVSNLLRQKITPFKRTRSQRFTHLDDECVKTLEDIGFVWSTIDKKWFEMLEWAKVYAVVNYHLSLRSNLSNRTASENLVDSNLGKRGEKVGDTNWRTKFESEDQQAYNNTQNSAILLENYYAFVQNIQNQSALTCFHPQDQILSLLLDENYSQNVLQLKKQTHLPSGPGTPTSQLECSPPLDYRVPTNDDLHYSLRIWCINQRSNYNRLQQEKATSMPSPFTTMTEQRKKALESVHFPWSGKFSNQWEQLEFERKQLAEVEKQREKERRQAERQKEEIEKVQRLSVARATTISMETTAGVIEKNVPTEDAVDIMDLWNAEDDDDDW
mmetsp:Transcript_20416/g.41416  ORF Transcript_20416/g.41416 Transcript_20416/m.41416 type:complete len:587 (+) Transcript_20416:50-1810(+)